MLKVFMEKLKKVKDQNNFSISFSCWLHDQSQLSVIYFLCSFGLNQKNQKFKPKTNAPLFLAGQRTWRVWKFVKTFCYRINGWGSWFVILESHKGAVFFVCLIKDVSEFSQTKKKALENSLSFDRDDILEKRPHKTNGRLNFFCLLKVIFFYICCPKRNSPLAQLVRASDC